MRYIAKKYQEELIIEADYFKLLSGTREVSSFSSSGNTVSTWVDAVFYKNGSDTPVAFVNQPYSVTEVALDTEDAGL